MSSAKRSRSRAACVEDVDEDTGVVVSGSAKYARSETSLTKPSRQQCNTSKARQSDVRSQYPRRPCPSPPATAKQFAPLQSPPPGRNSVPPQSHASYPPQARKAPIDPGYHAASQYPPHYSHPSHAPPGAHNFAPPQRPRSTTASGIPGVDKRAMPPYYGFPAGHMAPPPGHMAPPPGHMAPHPGHMSQPPPGHGIPPSNHMHQRVPMRHPGAMPPGAMPPRAMLPHPMYPAGAMPPPSPYGFARGYPAPGRPQYAPPSNMLGRGYASSGPPPGAHGHMAGIDPSWAPHPSWHPPAGHVMPPPSAQTPIETSAGYMAPPPHPQMRGRPPAQAPPPMNRPMPHMSNGSMPHMGAPHGQSRTRRASRHSFAESGSDEGSDESLEDDYEVGKQLPPPPRLQQAPSASASRTHQRRPSMFDRSTTTTNTQSSRRGRPDTTKRRHSVLGTSLESRHMNVYSDADSDDDLEICNSVQNLRISGNKHMRPYKESSGGARSQYSYTDSDRQSRSAHRASVTGSSQGGSSGNAVKIVGAKGITVNGFSMVLDGGEIQIPDSRSSAALPAPQSDNDPDDLRSRYSHVRASSTLSKLRAAKSDESYQRLDLDDAARYGDYEQANPMQSHGPPHGQSHAARAPNPPHYASPYGYLQHSLVNEAGSQYGYPTEEYAEYDMHEGQYAQPHWGSGHY